MHKNARVPGNVPRIVNQQHRTSIDPCLKANSMAESTQTSQLGVMIFKISQHIFSKLHL